MKRQNSLGRVGMLAALAVLLACAIVSQVSAGPNVNMCGAGDCMFLGTFSGEINTANRLEEILAGSGMKMKVDAVDIFSTPPNNTGSKVTTTRGIEDFLSGTWSSTKPIDFVGVKAGSKFALYQYKPASMGGLWSTSALTGNGKQPDVSYLAFFMKPAAVPEPSTTLLLGVALVGVVVARKAWEKRG